MKDSIDDDVSLGYDNSLGDIRLSGGGAIILSLCVDAMTNILSLSL